MTADSCPECVEGRVNTGWTKDGNVKSKKCPYCKGTGEGSPVAPRPEIVMPEPEEADLVG